MYEKKGIVYAEPFKLLRHKVYGYIAFQKKGDIADFNEIDAPIDDMAVNGSYVSWANTFCIQSIVRGVDYGYYKSKLVKRRYSNDDQIAIMLNKDSSNDDAIAYQKMQEWRNWAGAVAKKIVEITSQ